jgi:hypothetical protein
MSIGDPAEVEHLQANLRFLLNLWDPIGVADAVDDEYDCLLVPLWHRLTRAASRAEIAEYLWFDCRTTSASTPNPTAWTRYQIGSWPGPPQPSAITDSALAQDYWTCQQPLTRLPHSGCRASHSATVGDRQAAGRAPARAPLRQAQRC